MKKTMIFFLLMLTAITASAQSTARKFVLKNSSDGQSELTCYLPKKSFRKSCSRLSWRWVFSSCNGP